ncbi:hypothetical protein BH11ACT3_BH11ACT3_07040 [soil metagenome]
MDRERDRGGHDLIPRLRALWRPTPVHYASLIVGFALLLVLGRDQWFIYDDWAILHSDMDAAAWVAGHQGHWNTASTLVFQVLRSTVGLRSYLPYLVFALLAHLAVVHLVWRLMRRAQVAPWLATGVAATVILFGAAAENLLWAFQFGFMGAIALGLVVVVLMDRARLTTPTAIGIVAVSIVALTFSGTALPVLAAAFVLGFIRHGWWRALLLLAPAGVVYVAWYLAFSGGTPSSLAPHGSDFVTKVPLFIAAMFGAGYGQYVGVVPVGALVAIVLLIWIIRRFRHWRGPEASAYALIAGSVVFAVLTAVSRAGGELTAAGAQRYVYLIVMLALPTMALALGWVVTRGRGAAVAVAIAVALVGAVNVALLVGRAGEQAVIEQRVEREAAAAVDVLATEPGVADAQLPIPDVAPDLTVADLREGADAGLVPDVAYTAEDRQAVLEALGLAG